MADKKASGIQYDDFVNAIRSDPAQSEPLIMLAGYVGKSDTDGKLRIYPDASLGHWYEAAQDDVVHSRPIADSPLGGSNVWLKASAQVTPGVASVPKPEPKEGEEGEEGDASAEASPQVGADTGVFNPLTTIHPTLWTQIGCQGTGTIHPTIWTQIGCSTQAGCIQTVACLPPQGVAAQAQQISLPGCVQTGICISQPGCLPPPTIGCPILSVPGCLPPTHMLGCPRTSTCPPTQMPGCPSTSTCTPTVTPDCLPTSTCPPTHMLGCPSTSTCPPGGGYPQIPTIGICHTLGFTCTIVGCPGGGLGGARPGVQQIRTVQDCLPSLGCPQTSVGCVRTVQDCLPSLGCPHSVSCPPGGGFGAEAVHISLPGCIHTGICDAGGASTAATLCTRYGCGAEAFPMTSATLCTQISCPPTHMLGCPSTSTCPQTHMLGCPSTSTCPPTNMPGCPNTSTCAPGGGLAAQAVHISLPGCIHTGTCDAGGANTAATLCTQFGCAPTQMLGCPSTSTCPPTNMPGCPNTSTCTPGGGLGAEAVQISLPGCIHTGTCGQGGGSTAATVCTQMLGCPSTSTCPPQRTIATVCTRYDCPPTQAIGCFPTVSGPCLPYTMGGCY